MNFMESQEVTNLYQSLFLQINGDSPSSEINYIFDIE